MSETEATAAFAPRDAKDLASLFPGYEIQHLVATGGMGAVYCAVQESLDRIVAIKILPNELSQDPEFCSAFEAEAKAMAKLNHPNLIGVFDFGEVSGMLYIIMEYVEGETLFNITQGGVIKSSESLRLMQGICAGVASAHEHGILHRDIKPANILLDAHLQPKIGDFGLARPVDREVEDGEMIFGTPGYTAPEVIEPPHVFDQRADIFSLGVMLHELITGKLPEDDPRPASAQVRCHPRVDAVIRKATQLDPEQRFQTAADMAEELAKVSQPGLTKATTAIKLPVAAGKPTSSLTPSGAQVGVSPQQQIEMLRAAPQQAAPAGGPALRLGGGAALATPGMAPQQQATPSAAPGFGGSVGGPLGGPQTGGALGGTPSTMVMGSSGSSNTGVWVAVIILVFVGIVLIAVKGSDDGKPSNPQPKQDNLQQMIDSQMGPGSSEFDKQPEPEPAPKPEPEPEPAPEEEE